ncbi:unnamed protein product [Arctogadus glacialis]
MRHKRMEERTGLSLDLVHRNEIQYYATPISAVCISGDAYVNRFSVKNTSSKAGDVEIRITRRTHRHGRDYTLREYPSPQ